MVSYSIRGHLEMLFALDMAGDLLIYHHIVFVEGNSLSIIHLTANVEDIRPSDIRDITAHLITEVCHNVLIEPPLQQLSGEIMSLQSANVQDKARLDIAADGFWGCSHQRAFFDVRMFNPFARIYVNSPLSTCYKRNEADKRRNYDERVREIEHGSFTPLIFSTAGGMGPAGSVVFKRLASMISTKTDRPY